MLYKYYNHFEEIIYEGGNAGILTVVLCAEVEKDFALSHTVGLLCFNNFNVNVSMYLHAYKGGYI